MIPSLTTLPLLPVWVIGVWEEGAPEGEEPLEGIRLTSLVCWTCEQAWQRVEWYRARLSGGGRSSVPQNGMSDRGTTGAKRLLCLLSPLAVRLLHVRQAPERPAHEFIEPGPRAVLAAHVGLSPSIMTIGSFWTEVARMGGYLARRGDGPPGCKTLCKGWLHVQALLDGVHVACYLRL
jgi:hypothetical protein